MNIKKVDDKPRAIHTKEKPKIHSHVPKNRVHRRKLDHGVFVRVSRGIKDSKQSIKLKHTTLRSVGVLGAKIASDQMEGGQEVQQATSIMYEGVKPAIGISSSGAALVKRQAIEARRKKIKQVKVGKKIAKKTTKKMVKDVSKKAIKESVKQTTKESAKVTAKVAAATAGTAVSPGMGTLIGYAAGKVIEGKMDYVDMVNSNRARKFKFFLDKMKDEDNQKDSFIKLVKDLIIRRASLVVKQVMSIAVPCLLFSLFSILIICMPVISTIATIYNSPFALFLPPLEAGDTVSTVTSSYVSEFYRDVNKLANEHTGYDGGEIVYVDYEGTDANPSNYYDIMCVYMVKHGVEETATIMNDTSKEWLEEIVDDMCSYTTSTRTENYENEDGTTDSKTMLSVNISLKSYQDMISIYGFSTEEISLLDEMMRPENLAMLGYVGSSGGNSVSSLTQAEIDTILNAISDSTQKSVLNYALTKVGYPYSQELRDSGDYYDCSSLAYYSWKAAGVDISYGGATTAAAEAKGLNEAGKSVTESELMAGDLIFYSYTNNGRYMNISHVGIYAGNGMMVEAKNKAAGVVYGDFHSGSAVLYARPNK